MDHLNPVDNSHAAPPPDKAKDPVCGMAVNPATAHHKTPHKGKEYFFCSASCLAKFQVNPERILSSPPQPMGSGLASLGGTTLVKPTMVKPTGSCGKEGRADICPMWPEGRQGGPPPFPKGGMALEAGTPPPTEPNNAYTLPIPTATVPAGT